MHVNLDPTALLLARVAAAGPLPGMGPPRRPGRPAPNGGDVVTAIRGDELRFVLAALGARGREAVRAAAVALTAGLALDEVHQVIAATSALATADGPGPPRQRRVDALLGRLDDIAAAARFEGAPLLDGSVELDIDGARLRIEAVGTDRIGLVRQDERRFVLGDLRAGRPLNLVDGDGPVARLAISASREQVNEMQGRLRAFRGGPASTRLAAVGATVAGLRPADGAVTDHRGAIEAAALVRVHLLEHPVAAHHHRRQVLPLVG
ncbi:MAG: hypothetical protein ACYTG1_09145 [Planctomycetota bacterium]